MAKQRKPGSGISHNSSCEDSYKLEDLKRSIIVGVAGGSASGKTTFARELASYFEISMVDILFQDNYYKDQSDRFKKDGDINFDHPDAIDFKLLENHLSLLSKKQSVEVPIYDFATHSRLQETLRFESRSIIILDGILILTDPVIRSFLDVAVFIETPDEIRFQRRLKRDVQERGRKPEGVRHQYEKFVQPMYNQFIYPSKKWADLIVRGDADFTDSVDYLCDKLEKLLRGARMEPLSTL